ncbi:hypothetical protein [Subdoligranulum variabile]|uniref:hypothetical protein n=1 Tax=Subdoligranulum variabile TaxID=214851 RepID=UPI0026F0F65A|nr:hypothetical protein [Subdoligranulum variabile]
MAEGKTAGEKGGESPSTFSGGLFAQEKGSLLWQASPCNGPQCRFLPVCFAANAGKGKPLAALGVPYNKHSVNNNTYYMAKGDGLSRVDAGKIHKFRCLNLEETPIDKEKNSCYHQDSIYGCYW